MGVDSSVCFRERCDEVRVRRRVHEISGPKRWVHRRATIVGAVTLGASKLASAAAPPEVTPPQAVAGHDAVRVWYRGSAGCPDGVAFTELLRRMGRAVAIAGPGDRIDFVVNVASAGASSSGRLERQSSEGTIAIRDVVAASCEEVAAALALSLDLTLQPEPEGPLAPAPPPEAALRAGAQGTLESGLARAWLPGAAAFVEWNPAPGAWSFRLSLRGAMAEADSTATIDARLLASRAEVCAGGTLTDVALGICGAVDVGVVVAESPADGGRLDTGVWTSAAAHGRARWQLGQVVALEAQLGLLAPFVRYRFTARTGQELTDSAGLGLQTAVGVSFRL